MRRIKTKLLLGLIVVLVFFPLDSVISKPQIKTFWPHIEFEKPEVGVGNSTWFKLHTDYYSDSDTIYFTGKIEFWFSWQEDLKYTDTTSDPGYLRAIDPEWDSKSIPFFVYETVPAGDWNMDIRVTCKDAPSDWLSFTYTLEDIPFKVVTDETIIYETVYETETIIVTDTHWVTETTVIDETTIITSYVTEKVYETEVVSETSWVTKEIIITKQTADFVALSFIALALVGITLRRWRKRE